MLKFSNNKVERKIILIASSSHMLFFILSFLIIFLFIDGDMFRLLYYSFLSTVGFFMFFIILTRIYFLINKEHAYMPTFYATNNNDLILFNGYEYTNIPINEMILLKNHSLFRTSIYLLKKPIYIQKSKKWYSKIIIDDECTLNI